MSDHAKLLSKIFCQLIDTGNIDNSWLASEVRRIENFKGGVDVLVDRIASIRIWTYISNKSDWLCDALGWQEKTRKIEDQLSDALHEQLIQRFVDQRTTVLLNKLKSKKISGADV